MLVPRLLRGLGPRGYLVLTFDEGSSTPALHGRAGADRDDRRRPGRRPRPRPAPPVDHYGVLRTIEDTFGLPPLGAAADPRNGSLRQLLR